MTRYIASSAALRRESARTDTAASGALIKTLATSSGAYTEGALTVGTVPIAGLTLGADTFAQFEAALTVATVPINGLTVTDSFGTGGVYTEPALTIATVPISGLGLAADVATGISRGPSSGRHRDASAWDDEDDPIWRPQPFDFDDEEDELLLLLG